MKLGFDIDGITCNMGKALVELINEKYGLNHDIHVVKNHDLHSSDNLYTDDPELNEEIAMSMRTEIVENPEAIINLEAHEEAVIALRKFSKSGHTIHHITSRPNIQFDATMEWLRANKIPFNTVHVIGNSGKGGHKVSKGGVGRFLNLDFYIDDCSYHLDDMYRYKNRWRKGLALFTQPWNENEIIDFSRYVRFDNWDQVIRHLGIHKR